jgi:DNA invertase Pin-like site-specific DNA recombinase
MKQTLGIEIQRRAISDYVRRVRGEIVAWYEDFGSASASLPRLGKHQPELERALAHAREIGAALTVARLDRLTRSTVVLCVILETGPRLVVAETPNAGPFVLQIYAAVAEEYRRQVSRRCRAGIAAAKARGVERNPHAKRVGQMSRDAARAHASKLRPMMEEIRTGSSMTRDEVAAELNARGIRPMIAARWDSHNVSCVWSWFHRRWRTQRFPGRFSQGAPSGLAGAKAFEQKLRPVIVAYRNAGAVTAREIMDHLNNDGLTTRAGLRWSKANTHRLLGRLAKEA